MRATNTKVTNNVKHDTYAWIKATADSRIINIKRALKTASGAKTARGAMSSIL